MFSKLILFICFAKAYLSIHFCHEIVLATNYDWRRLIVFVSNLIARLLTLHTAFTLRRAEGDFIRCMAHACSFSPLACRWWNFHHARILSSHLTPSCFLVACLNHLDTESSFAFGTFTVHELYYVPKRHHHPKESPMAPEQFPPLLLPPSYGITTLLYATSKIFHRSS